MNAPGRDESINGLLKKKADELAASEARFKSLVETIPDIVYRIDKQGHFLFVNDAINKLGYKPDEVIGEHFSAIILPADLDRVSRNRVLPRLSGAVTGDAGAPGLFDERRRGNRQTKDLEVRLISKDQKLSPGLLRTIGDDIIVAEINSAGDYGISSDESISVFIGTVGVIRDISPRKRMERFLRESQDTLEMKVEERTSDLKASQARLVLAEKKAAVDKLIAGIAHELNNPMMSIINFIQYCLKNSPESGKIREVLKDAERETRRCIGILEKMMNSSVRYYGSEAESDTANPDEIIDRALEILADRIKRENITVTRHKTEPGTRIPLIVGDIQQVFIQIIDNALCAIEGCPEKEIHIRTERKAEGLMISFEDSGCGVTEDHMGRLFDPFFTTKQPGLGTGMGLPLARSIVSAHGGEIVCERRKGNGSIFKVFLPFERKYQ